MTANISLALVLCCAATAQQTTPGPLLFEITSAPGATIPKGLTKQLQATRSFFRGNAVVGNATEEVTWTSSSPVVATVSNAPGSKGLITAQSLGPATITATSGPTHASYDITVVAPVPKSLNVIPANTDIDINANQIFGATANLSDGTVGPVAVNWSSSQSVVATIDGGGLATGKADGNTIITAMDPVSGKFATATLNVGLTAITVTPPNPSIPLGTTQQFTATGMFSAGGSSDVTNDVVWASSSPLIATIDQNTGLATSVSSNINPTTITAASGAVNGATSLTVTPPALVNILVSPLNPALLVGKVQQFTAMGVYTAGPNQDLTALATWSSDTPAVAIIGMSTGVGTTIAVGKATISASFGGKTGTSLLSVRPGSRFAYIANQDDATISIYALNENSGNLRVMGYALNSTGQGAETMATDVNGKFLYLANSATATISGFAINNANGQLSPVPNSPFIAGLQPSSIALDGSGKFAYVTNQASDNLSAFSIDAAGNLNQLSTPTYSTKPGSKPAQVVFDPSGAFLYVADSGTNKISAFKFNSADGSLTEISGSPFASGGSGPQAIAFDASGQYLYVLNKASSRINVLILNPVTGALTLLSGSNAVGANPAALISDPSGSYIYAANPSANSIYAFNVNPATGALTMVAGSPFAVPGAPQALSIDAAGFYLYAVDANTDEVAIFGIEPDGSLILVKSTRARKSPGAMVFSAGNAGQFLPAFAEVTTQNATDGGLISYSVSAGTGALTVASSATIGTQGSNAVTVDPSGKFVYTLQQSDGKISAFTLDGAGNLGPVSTSPFPGGSNPIALTAEPSGRFLYLADLIGPNNVLGYQLNGSSGMLNAVTGSPFIAGNEPLSIAADPTGSFLYTGNFAANNITAFAIDPGTGKLTAVNSAFTSASPNALAVHPTGRFLYVANESNNLKRIQIFGIDPTTGALTGGASNVPSGNATMSISIDPAGRFLYTANRGDGSISAFTIDQNTGLLSQITGSPYTGLAGPIAGSVDPSGMFLYVVEQNGNQVTLYSIDQTSNTAGALTKVLSFPAKSGPNAIAVTASFQ